jgi:hypothetical protein
MYRSFWPLRPTDLRRSSGSAATAAGVGRLSKSASNRRSIVAAAFDDSCCEMIACTSARNGSSCCARASPHGPCRRTSPFITGSRRESVRHAAA